MSEDDERSVIDDGYPDERTEERSDHRRTVDSGLVRKDIDVMGSQSLLELGMESGTVSRYGIVCHEK